MAFKHIACPEIWVWKHLRKEFEKNTMKSLTTVFKEKLLYPTKYF